MIDSIVFFIKTIILSIWALFIQNSFVIGLEGQPTSFLPHEAKNDNEKYVSELVFRKLFKYDNDTLIYDLVSSVDKSKDNLEYKIKLKDDIYWQNGNPITSKDIIYSISLYENLINSMDIEKLSDKEVKIKLNTPLAILPNLLTFGIEPADIPYQDKFGPIGSTSFVITNISHEREKIEGVTVVSTQPNKTFNKISFKFYDNQNDLKTAYKLGEIESFYSDTEYNTKDLDEYNATFLGRYFVLLFNTNKPVFQDVKTRNKLKDSLNVTNLLETENYYRTSLLAEGPISNTIYTKDSLKLPNYVFNTKLDLTEAKLLEEMNILLPNNKDGTQIEPFLREYWEKNLNIKLIVQYLPMDEIIDKVRTGDFDMVFVGHEISPDPDRYAYWHSSQVKNLNLGRFSDLRSDKALEEGRKTNSLEERLKHYHIFQNVFETKTPAIFLYHPGKYLYVTKSKSKFLTLPKKLYYPWDIVKNL